MCACTSVSLCVYVCVRVRVCVCLGVFSHAELGMDRYPVEMLSLLAVRTGINTQGQFKKPILQTLMLNYSGLHSAHWRRAHQETPTITLTVTKPLMGRTSLVHTHTCSF